MFKQRLLLRTFIQQRRDGSIADPFKVIEVDPATIEGYYKFNRWHAGRVIEGDWDRKTVPFKEHYVYRGMYERFVDGVAWEDTEYFTKMVKKIDANGHMYGCWSPEEFLDVRCTYLDDLFTAIAEEGYKPQDEIDDAERAEHRHVRLGAQKTFHEVVVNVHRDGVLSCSGGKHRLAIAKLQDLDSIPVQVGVRHDNWQKIRREVYVGSREIDEQNFHPDLLDVINGR